jgi:hypothetical protein
MMELKKQLNEHCPERFPCWDFVARELPDRMMRTHGWFLVDFGPAPDVSMDEAIVQWDDYLAGMVALAGYIMYPKLAMYAGRAFKGLNVPTQLLLGLIVKSVNGGHMFPMLGQASAGSVLPYPTLTATSLRTNSGEPRTYRGCAIPRIVWPSL